MGNPLRSEGAAFRFLIATIVYFALIAVASTINTWLGLAVFVALSAGVIGWAISSNRRRTAAHDDRPS